MITVYHDIDTEDQLSILNEDYTKREQLVADFIKNNDMSADEAVLIKITNNIKKTTHVFHISPTGDWFPQ